MGRRLTVEADGGSRGNPGVAGFGALVRDASTGALLAERAEPLGKVSNNVAEYRGLIAGLLAAQALDEGADVEARMDSKLVVEQMSGRWKIKHQDMRRLAREAGDIAAAIVAAGGSVEYTWIPRAENSAADALSNVGMDGASVQRSFGGEPTLDSVPTAAQADEARQGRSEAERERSIRGTGGAGRGDPTRVVLVRHGVTEFTETGRLDGRGGEDPVLSTAGEEQAAAAGRLVVHLLAGAPARVVTSSLARAKQTGAAVAEAIGVSADVDPDWDEQNFGDWNDASIPALLEADSEAFLRLRNDPAYARPGGESHLDLAERVVQAWERVVAEGGTTVVVCHRKPIMVTLAHLLGMDHVAAWRLAAAPGSLTGIEIWPGGEISVAFTNRH